MYLAEKTGQFLPENSPKARAELLSWLMFLATGIGPYSGQAVHFKHFAPNTLDYAVNRYEFEARRHSAFSMRSWRTDRTSSGRPTPSQTCRRGAGHVPCRSF